VEEAKQQGWLDEIAGLEVSLAAANDKLTAMNGCRGVRDLPS